MKKNTNPNNRKKIMEKNNTKNNPSDFFGYFIIVFPVID